MTDHNTDTPPIYFKVYYLAISILIPTGTFPGLHVLFWIGAGLFLLPFALSILALPFLIIFLAITKPVVGAIMAFVGVNITMIAMHCPESLFNLAFSSFWAVMIPILLYPIGQLCRSLYYQRKAVVRKAVVVHRFTKEENNNNNNSASSLVKYYWVGEYEAPSSQQRFHKKFLVTGDLYDAASLEVSVLPGRPKSAMLTKQMDYYLDSSPKVFFALLSIAAIAFAFGIPIWIFGVKATLLRFSEQEDVCGECTKCTAGWQAFLPYIASVVMAILAVSNFLWKTYQKREFAAVTVDNPAGGEQELVTVVGPQNKKEEDEYHHHINDDGDDKTETETACTSRELDNDDETACTRELDNEDDTTYIREPVGTGRNGAFLV